MLTAKEQTHYDAAKRLAVIVRKTQGNGRHDGLGNPVIDVELYEQWAGEACDGVEWALAEVKRLRTIVDRLPPETKDGVVLIPGRDRAYWSQDSRPFGTARFIIWSAHVYWDGDQWRLRNPIPANGSYPDVEHCWSTSEAAEAAGGK